MQNNKSRLFGIHARPPWWLGYLPFVAVVVIYVIASDIYLGTNPNGRIVPSLHSMGLRLWDLAFGEDHRTHHTFLLWRDMWSSLYRFVIGIVISAFVGLWFGVNMALFPGMRCILLKFVTMCSNVPTVAFLSMLILMLGVDDFSKVTLVFLATVFYITRDMYAETLSQPQPLLDKARTLGASQIALVYRIVLPLVMPRLFETVRLSLSIAWWALIVSEGIAAEQGLGYRIFLHRRYFDNETIIPYALVVTAIAVGINYLMIFVQDRLYPWKKKQED